MVVRFPLFDAPPREPSAFVGYAGNDLDRRSELRTDTSTSDAMADPAARLLLIANGKLIFNKDGSAYHSVEVSGRFGVAPDSVVLLGWNAQGPVLAAQATVDVEAEGGQIVDFRALYAGSLLLESTMGEIAQGAALLAWHGSHGFCGRCGNETGIAAGGYKRVCPQCGAEHFPRTDPVAIMLAVEKDRCLLGRGTHFAPGVYSTLAGFIEPGETIENAVRREIFEESGIQIGRVAYHASQPWPFPYSLMIGCFAEATSNTIIMDKELEDCRWFSRADVQRALRNDPEVGFRVPPPMAIAHHLIRAWAEMA